MKFSFVDLNGHTVTGDCEFIDHPAQSISHALATEIKNSTALDGVLGEFSFIKKVMRKMRAKCPDLLLITKIMSFIVINCLISFKSEVIGKVITRDQEKHDQEKYS